MNRRQLYVLRVLLPSLVLLALIVGCAPAPDQEPAQATTSVETPEKTLILGKNVAFVSLDPHICYEWDCTMSIRAAYEGLVTWDGDDFTQVVPLVAQSWDVSADGKTYTFQLRPDVTFASGRNLTADDVKFSYDRLRNKNGPVAWYMAYVDTVEVVDDSTIQFNLNDPNAAFLSILTSPAFGILDAEVMKANGGVSEEGADEADQATAWLDQNSAGSGPYIVKGWAPNEEVIMERNPDYWGTAPYFDKVVLRYVPDPQTQRQMLERGDIDVAMDLDPDTIAELGGESGVETVQGSILMTMYLGLTTNPEINEALADKKVRQAISYAIDYDGIIELMAGAGRKIPSIFPIGFIGVDQSMWDMVAEQIGERYDPEKARKLLEESDYEGDISFTLVYRTIATDELVSQKIQSDLEEIGINVELAPLVPDAFWSNYRVGEVEAAYTLWGPDYVDPDNWAQAFATNEGPAAAVHFYEPTFSDLASAAIATTDVGERSEIYRDIQLKLLDDAAFIGIMQQDAQVATAEDLRGYVVVAPWHTNIFDLFR